MIHFLRRTNIRSSPSLSGTILRTTQQGETGQLLSPTPTAASGHQWYNVDAGGTTGWCARVSAGVELFSIDAEQSQLDQYKDRELLALMIAGEAGNQSLAGQVAVACVPFKRLVRQETHYGLSLRTILLRPNQFSTFNGDHWRGFVGRIPDFLLLADLAMGGLLSSPTASATHYCRYDLAPMPDWSQPRYSIFLARIGEHNFYQEK